MKRFKRKSVILLIIFIILYPAGYRMRSANSNPLSQINSFRVYYGSINEDIINQMNELDMVILESLQLNTDQIKKIREKTKIFGYLSVIEIANWDRELISKINEGDYLSLNGQRVAEKDYDNDLGNIDQSHFRQVLLETIEQRIISKGLDGVFLDTVDWIDYYQSLDHETYWRLKLGYEQLLLSIKQKYPRLLVIQNRGFDTFKDTTHKYVDGLLWENFDIEKYENAKRDDQVKRTAEAKHVTIFLILAKNTRQNTEFAKKNHWPAIYKEHSYSVW